jgi:hypothetical protein
MRLPGGVWQNGERRRDFAFKPLTGAVELALFGGGERGRDLSRPEQVTSALAAALLEVGGRPATPESVRSLTVGDRQFLTRQLAALLGRDGLWLTAACAACGADYDCHVEQSKLPAKPAGESPEVEIETSLGRCRFRPLNGGDQEAVAGLDDGTRALSTLARRCLVAVGERELGPGEAAELELDEEDLASVDRALEDAAPEATVWIQAACPDCGETNQVWVDPYDCLDGGDELFAEIHQLASSYHWSEAEILALPPKRRRLYLRLIDSDRGMVQ